MNSIRHRLMLWLVGSTAVVGAAAGMSLYVYVRQVLLADFDVGLPANMLVVVARDQQDLERVQATLGWGLALAGIVIVVGGFVAVRGVVGRALVPLADLSRDVSDMGPNTLNRRFHATALPLELQP